MERKSKNITYEEMLEAGRKRAKDYYEKNKEKCRQKALDRYNRIKNSADNKKNKYKPLKQFSGRNECYSNVEGV